MLRGWDSDPRPRDYEPRELPLLYPAIYRMGKLCLPRGDRGNYTLNFKNFKALDLFVEPTNGYFFTTHN